MEPTVPDASPEPGKPDMYLAIRLERHAQLGDLPVARAISFRLDGRSLPGREGEPILAALLANGVRVCRTMPNSGEARGGFCFVGRCSDCLMIVDGVPSVQTCVTPLVDGMEIAVQRGLGHWSVSDSGAAR